MAKLDGLRQLQYWLMGALLLMLLSVSGYAIAGIGERLVTVERCCADTVEIRNDVKWIMQMVASMERKIDRLQAESSARRKSRSIAEKE